MPGSSSSCSCVAVLMLIWPSSSGAAWAGLDSMKVAARAAPLSMVRMDLNMALLLLGIDADASDKASPEPAAHPCNFNDIDMSTGTGGPPAGQPRPTRGPADSPLHYSSASSGRTG